MADKVYNVLFICTGNSARSILAEGLMTHLGGVASRRSPQAAPQRKRQSVRLSTLHKLRIRRWLPQQELGRVRARSPALDFVFTVCDKAAGEVCPCGPVSHDCAWGVPDPLPSEAATSRRPRPSSTPPSPSSGASS